MANNATNVNPISFPYNFGPLTPPSLPRDNGLYSTGTTQLFAFGTRCISWDGKIYRYSKSGAACWTGRGNRFWNAIPATGIDYQLLVADAADDAIEIQVTNGTTVEQTKDGLAGGHVVLKPTSTSTDAEVFSRTITNNSACAISGTCIIQLDAAIGTALTTDSYAIVMPSPWSNIRFDATNPITSSFAGPATTPVSASGYCFWTQTWGEAWVAAQTARVGVTAAYRTCYWRHDGTVDIATTINNYVSDQIAGFILDNNSEANGMTKMMLQVSI